MRHIIKQLMAASLLSFGFSLPANAHCHVGNRFFPATITIDDPCVADELSFPTIAGFKNGDNPAQQRERFIRFIELGKKLDIPLIIHSRKAEQDVIDLYLEFAKAKNWHLIDCTKDNKLLDKTTISESVWRLVSTRLDRSKSPAKEPSQP